MFMACGTVWAKAKQREKEDYRWVVTQCLLCSKEKQLLGNVYITSFSLPPEKRMEGQTQFVVSQYFTLSFMKWLPGSSPADVVEV